jgi:ribulose 1,5-bisphosphate synthetase/thiazole synthase
MGQENGLRSHMAVPRVKSTSDAVVIGAGHNGLVAAVLLAKAGWSVTGSVANQLPSSLARVS